MERGLERRRVAARLGVEKIPLEHGVVQRGIGIDVRLEDLVILVERRRAVALLAIGREDCAVLAVCERRVGAARQRDGRVPDVSRRERRVRVVRRRGQPARQREEVLAFLVEHVLLLTIEILHRKPVDRETRLLAHPALHRRERHLQQFRIEPGRGLGLLCEQDLHLLAPCVDLIVPLVLVVPQRREVPHPVLELSNLIPKLQRRQELARTIAQGTLQRGKARDLAVELFVRPLPRAPIGKDLRQIPLEPFGDRLTFARREHRWRTG